MSDYFDRVERQLVRTVEAGVRRRWRWPAWLVPVAAALVVVAVVAVFLSIRGGRRPPAGTAPGSSVVFVSSAPAAGLDRAAQILRLRLGAMFSGVHVTRSGHEIVASADGASRSQLKALAAPGRLVMYDWEANVLTPTGATVASQLAADSPSALGISQGSAAGASGSPSAGAMSLYDAVSLASRQPLSDGRKQWEYYMFGAAGSAGCRLVHWRGSGHCLLGGPAPTAQQLVTTLPAGVITAMGVQFPVPHGTVVLQAAAPRFDGAPAISDPASRFFVLRDDPATAAGFVTDPHAARDASGQPNVEFGFTPGGARAFHLVTAAVARRGALLSRTGQTLNQHFAIALDGRLLTVPSIDFRTYPDGISGRDGADIEAGFTTQSAREVATLLRYGPLPVNLRPQSR